VKYFKYLLLSFIFLGQVFGLEVPNLTGPVVDLAQIYSSEEVIQLSNLCQQLVQKGGPQFQILTVPSLEGMAIEDFSIRVVEKWKLGSKDKGNGILLTISTADRKMRIEVGQGIEGEITDSESYQYIQKILKPAFKKQRFYEGTGSVILIVAKKFNIELSSNIKRDFTRSHFSNGQLLFFIIIFVFISIISRFRGSSYSRGNYYRDHYYGSSHSSSYRDSGSSWSGGGGGFSGGGSSGDW
jgi:uncharacterized protein